MILESWCYR